MTTLLQLTGRWKNSGSRLGWDADPDAIDVTACVRGAMTAAAAVDGDRSSACFTCLLGAGADCNDLRLCVLATGTDGKMS